MFSGWIGRIPAIGDKNPKGFFHIVRRFFHISVGVVITGVAPLRSEVQANRAAFR